MFELFGNTVLSKGEWLKDWKAAIYEYQSALYDSDGDIEKSLHTQGILDLYPLHKRVLGLVEHIIISNLKGKHFEGPASEIFTSAYVGEYDRKRTEMRPPLCSWGKNSNERLHRRDGVLATLETEGNWLVLARDDLVHGTSAPLSLAGLLNRLISVISTAPEMNGLGVEVRFNSLTPAYQAKQINALTQCSKQAAYMSLCLGKIAIMLRNAIEHGLDEPKKDGLMIDCSGYWKERRKPHDWNLRNSHENEWRGEFPLPSQLPPTANGFLLTPASLECCLVLVSLVLKASRKQLGL